MGNTKSDNLNNDSEISKAFHRKYDTKGVLGRGTFAVVKRIVRKSDKREFAVKVLNKNHLTRKEIKGLKQEVKIMYEINHPNIVKCYDYYDTSVKVKMVLELCDGGDLMDDLLNSPNKCFKERKAALTLIKLAFAIEHLHNNFVVHRDLKPENVLLTKAGDLKITDFGLSHYSKLEPKFHSMYTCCGTPHYVAPEVLSDSSYGVEVDYWSLGVMLYIFLSGTQPFNSHSINKMYSLICSGSYIFPSKYWKNISKDAIVCVKSLMEVKPEKRLNCRKLLQNKWINKCVPNLKELDSNNNRYKSNQPLSGMNSPDINSNKSKNKKTIDSLDNSNESSNIISEESVPDRRVKSYS